MKVILIAAMSVDGKIAESAEQNSLDWTSKEDTRFFIEKTKESGVVIMGSKTFNTIGRPLKDRRLIVMTYSPEDYSVNGVEFTKQQPNELLARLKKEGHESVVVAGGSSVYSIFIREGLITDYFLTIEPVLFGKGVPFAHGFDRVNLKLVNSTRLGEHSVLLHLQEV